MRVLSLFVCALALSTALPVTVVPDDKVRNQDAMTMEYGEENSGSLPRVLGLIS